MYIVNATKEMLNTWYKCNKLIGKYIETNLHIPMIHRDNNHYYFVNTELLKEALNYLPLYLKIIKSF
jgi:hypothetical protein